MLKTHKRLLVEKPQVMEVLITWILSIRFFKILSLFHLREPRKLKRNWIFF